MNRTKINVERYGSHLYSGHGVESEGSEACLFGKSSPTVMGFEVMNAAFDSALGA